MPHDRRNRELQDGDLVNVPCRIKRVSTEADYCNVELETVEPMPGNNTCTSMHLNTRQVELVSRPSEQS